MKQTLLQLTTLVLLMVVAYAQLQAQTPPSLDQYLQKRQALMQQDSQLYFDYAISLSEKEQVLNEQLITLQKKMIQKYKEEHFFPPARNFYQSKKHIEETVLFQFFKEMPKGGMLHLHSGAMGDADWMIKKAQSMPEMYIYWDTKSTGSIAKGTLHAYKKGKAPQGFVHHY